MEIRIEAVRPWPLARVLPYFAVIAFALILREAFVLIAWCPDLSRGDSGMYLAYAANLIQHGTFSQTGTTPDAFRSPGYPLLLALMRSTPAMLQLQVALGVATVGCVMGLARQWLTKPWALAAGVWMALQPHNIAATGALLGEVAFGACIAGGLLCAALAFRRRSLQLSLLAGAIFGFGYLVNPVLAFLPFLLAVMFWRAGATRQGIALALVALLAIGGWSARNLAVGARGDTRAVINLVQGSFPEYHAAWRLQRLLMHDKYVQVGREVEAATHGDYSLTVARLKSDPVKYVGWYLSKPFLLFDWDVRIGQGGVYTVLENNSPLDKGWLLVTTALQTGLNPLVFCFAFCGIVLAFWRGGPERMVAVAVLYLTCVHVVLQAEPRYAISYRSLEILLAVSAVAFLRTSFVSKRA